MEINLRRNIAQVEFLTELSADESFGPYFEGDFHCSRACFFCGVAYQCKTNHPFIIFFSGAMRKRPTFVVCNKNTFYLPSVSVHGTGRQEH